jgi:hypothetical protein
VAAVVVLWTSMLVGVNRTGLGLSDERPLSHLGTDPRSAAVFGAGLLVASVLLVAFAWFVHTSLSPAPGFLPAFLVGQAGQVVVAVVPIDGAGVGHEVHTAAGIVLGLSLSVLMWRFAAGQPPGPRRSWAYGLFWFEVAASLAGVALSRSMRAPLAEVVPATAFHLWIAVVTAWRPTVGAARSPASAP